MGAEQGDERAELAALDRISDGVIAVDDEDRYTYVNDAATTLLGRSREELLGECVWDVFPGAADGPAPKAFQRARDTGSQTSYTRYSESLDEWFRVRVYPGEGGLTVFFADVSAEKRREESLTRLHEATREMLSVESPVEVARLVSEAAIDILGLRVNGVHFYDEETDALEPVAQSDGSKEIIGDAPAIDEGIAWRAFQNDEVLIYDDVSSARGVMNPETPMRSELFVPLGEFGVFIVASSEPAAFSETDVAFARLLGANATTALKQLDTEIQLAHQRDSLELLTQMMSHDIRNDLQVVTAVTELLADAVDDEHAEYVRKIHTNAASAVELTNSARDLAETMRRPERETEPVGLADALERQIEELQHTHDVRATVEGTLPRVTVAADDLLDSVFRNLLKNAVEHNKNDDPSVVVSASADDETATVRVADDGPGVPDDRKREVFGRGERGLESHGTGIGLYLVQTLVDQYGGDVWIEDNEPTGAVFVVELRRA
ncbi:sensor histidine kinase [Haloarcula litorea]|uniref:sensor histidine kinase n=1 Tax=Haloarcula litorea TaxID=3032579 RepID=UPI0023E87578|nr:ATP-binding protein [Halomicroarcula sp. GDY20]